MGADTANVGVEDYLYMDWTAGSCEWRTTRTLHVSEG